MKSTIIKRLKIASNSFNWRWWSTGIYTNGKVYLEFETSSRYDEIQFESLKGLYDFTARLVAKM